MSQEQREVVKVYENYFFEPTLSPTTITDQGTTLDNELIGTLDLTELKKEYQQEVIKAFSFAFDSAVKIYKDK